MKLDMNKNHWYYLFHLYSSSSYYSIGVFVEAYNNIQTAQIYLWRYLLWVSNIDIANKLFKKFIDKY